ncbi:unnamed protein product [Meloidogyne enterolobii]|uniref:Uncharacterized protein n=1 Tax=Meloidogyne enterolobii TaxID=390850 RepID=A0ACB0YNL3_MELEN
MTVFFNFTKFFITFKTNDLSIFTSNYASALTIINYIIIIFCGISIQIHVYRYCKGVEMTKLRNMNKQMSIVLGAQVNNCGKGDSLDAFFLIYN